MRYFFHFTILILFISLLSCSKQNNRLIVDEIFISKHMIGPQKSWIKFTPLPGVKIPKKELILKDTTRDFCEEEINILHSTYRPEFIIKIDRSGRINGFIKNCKLNRKGYFNLVLSDSKIDYINDQILKSDYKKLDTLYTGYGEGITEYFVSIKNGDDEKQIMIIYGYKGTKVIRNLIDSLYKYANTLKLSDKIDLAFRKDTLIVLKTENYYQP